MQEMIVIMKTLKADPSYAFSQAGLGDFIATGMSSYSSNHSLGRELAEASNCKRKSEGCEALPSLVKMLGPKTMKSLPLLGALFLVIEKGADVKDTFENVFCA
jgi:glycerol-3-phosphate dehydrogenase